MKDLFSSHVTRSKAKKLHFENQVTSSETDLSSIPPKFVSER